MREKRSDFCYNPFHGVTCRGAVISAKHLGLAGKGFGMMVEI